MTTAGQGWPSLAKGQLTTAQQRSVASWMSGGGVLRRGGNLGTRVLSGRMGAFDNTTPKTFRAIIALGQHFDRIRVIFANGNPGGTYTVAGCNVRALADPNVLTTPVSVAVPSSGVVPAAPSSRRSYLVSAWADISSVSRSDGGTYPLVCVDAYISTAGSITILGNGGSDNFANWATRPGRSWTMQYNDGDCVTTPGNFVSVTNRIQSPIVGVQYAARGRVITVMGCGDSIVEGRGTYIAEGWGVPACEAVSSMSGVTVEWFSNAWAGLDMVGWVGPSLEDACAAGLIPDIVVSPCGSPNNFGTPITTANINACRQGLARLLAAARDYQVVPLIVTVIPTNPAIKDFNASDSLRRGFNDEIRSYRQRGYPVLDMDEVMAGIVDGDGQTNILAGATTDNIHPNDLGNTLMSNVLVPVLKTYAAMS